MPQPAVLFPDATAVVISALTTANPGAGVSATVVNEVPNPRPDELVLVRRLGGPRLNLVVDQAQLAFECWAPTNQRAHDIAARERALVYALRGSVVDGVSIYRVEEVAGLGELPDPLSTSPRFVFSALVHVRGVAL